MKLSLKHFLLVSLLLGAVALPLGYKYLKMRREAKIERLTEELQQQRIALSESERPKSYWGRDDQRRVEALRRLVAQTEARLEKLTGKRPERPIVPDFEILGPVFTIDVDESPTKRTD